LSVNPFQTLFTFVNYELWASDMSFRQFFWQNLDLASKKNDLITSIVNNPFFGLIDIIFVKVEPTFFQVYPRCGVFKALSTMRPRNLSPQQSAVILGLCLRKTSHGYRHVIVFKKLRFQNIVRPH